jgi:hypothetical protein
VSAGADGAGSAAARAVYRGDPARQVQDRRADGAGDVILSGTPANSRPVEEVSVEVEGLGTLTNTVVDGESGIPEGFGAQPSESEAVRAVALGTGTGGKTLRTVSAPTSA